MALQNQNYNTAVQNNQKYYNLSNMANPPIQNFVKDFAEYSEDMHR